MYAIKQKRDTRNSKIEECINKVGSFLDCFLFCRVLNAVIKWYFCLNDKTGSLVRYNILLVLRIAPGISPYLYGDKSAFFVCIRLQNFACLCKVLTIMS